MTQVATGGPFTCPGHLTCSWGASRVGARRDTWSGVRCSRVPRLVALGESCPPQAECPACRQAEPTSSQTCMDGTGLATETPLGPSSSSLEQSENPAYFRLFQGARAKFGEQTVCAGMVCH